jgi:hypothetical protein
MNRLDGDAWDSIQEKESNAFFMHTHCPKMANKMEIGVCGKIDIFYLKNLLVPVHFLSVHQMPLCSNFYVSC